MPTLRFSLKDPDDAHVDDTWMIYHAFIGRYYQRAVDSHAGIQMCKEFPMNGTYLSMMKNLLKLSTLHYNARCLQLSLM